MADEDTRECLDCGQTVPLSAFRKNASMRGGYTNRCKPCLRVRDEARWSAMSPEDRAALKRRYADQVKQMKRSNPEKVRAQKHAHYEKTKERNKQRCYEWRRKNPERLRELSKGWCAKRQRGVADGISAAQLADWSMAQKKACHWCGKPCAYTFHIDHIVPLSRGGPHEPHNLCIACPPCNLTKNARDPIEFAQSIGKLL